MILNLIAFISFFRASINILKMIITCGIMFITLCILIILTL